MKTLLFMAGTFTTSVLLFIYVKVTLPFFMLLDKADKLLVELLNFDGGEALDSFFYFVSSKTAWIPVGVLFVCWLLSNRRYRRQTLLVVMAIALTVTICDQVSSSLIKPAVERLRPSHCAAIINELHFVNNYHGGRFGFCSSHAANATGVFIFISLLLRKKAVICPLLLWTVLVCYSRIYLGVHYPGDIICGCFVGIVCGTLVYRLYMFTETKLYTRQNCVAESSEEQLSMNLAVEESH